LRRPTARCCRQVDGERHGDDEACEIVSESTWRRRGVSRRGSDSSIATNRQPAVRLHVNWTRPLPTDGYTLVALDQIVLNVRVHPARVHRSKPCTVRFTGIYCRYIEIDLHGSYASRCAYVKHDREIVLVPWLQSLVVALVSGHGTRFPGDPRSTMSYS
jgi:hypothetical protein